MEEEMLFYWKQGFKVFERFLKRKQEREYAEGMSEVMRLHIKNLPVKGAKSDTGWIVEAEGRCYTTWKREIETDAPPHEVMEYLQQNEDYPGWTGVEYSAYKSKEGKLYFHSTYDSGD